MEIKTNFDDWKNELFERFGSKNLIKSKCKNNKKIIIFLKSSNHSNILVGQFDKGDGQGYLFDRRKSIRKKTEQKINKSTKKFADFELINN